MSIDEGDEIIEDWLKPPDENRMKQNSADSRRAGSGNHVASPKRRMTSTSSGQKDIVVHNSFNSGSLRSEYQIDEDVAASFLIESFANESMNASSVDGGSQNLSEWWKRTYSSSQDPEINNVISQALTSSLYKSRDDASQSRPRSVSNDTSNTQLIVAKKMTMVLSTMHSESDDDDIFGGNRR